MISVYNLIKKFILFVLGLAASSSLTACATLQIAPSALVESLPEATTIPYRVSSAGRFIVDISVNGHPAQPFSIDTGATVSVLYDGYTKLIDITSSGQTVFVRGLVSKGTRPIIENVDLHIGTKPFALDKIVVLETTNTKDEAIGLLGSDVLMGYTALFNKDTMMATFVPSQNILPRSFKGWRRIQLGSRTDSQTDTRLYFAHTELKQKKVPILIDTGSNLNFINWKLAAMDDNIRDLERNLLRQGKLQGALDTTLLTKSTILYDLSIGTQHWAETDVVIMELDSLSAVAPIDQPMMIAGSGMFSPWTVAFDLGGNSIYIRPKSNELASP